MAEKQEKPAEKTRIPIIFALKKCPHCGKDITLVFDQKALTCYQQSLDKAKELMEKGAPGTVIKDDLKMGGEKGANKT